VKEISTIRAEQRASEASLRKRHEESLGQQKALFERQLGSVEMQEMQAEQASLEERLARTESERDAAARNLVTASAAIEAAAKDASVAREESAALRARLERALEALEDLAAIDRDAAMLRQRATDTIGNARAALEAVVAFRPSSLPPPTAVGGESASDIPRPPRPLTHGDAAAAAGAAAAAAAPPPAPTVATAPPSAVAAVAAPAPVPAAAPADDAEISFAGIAPSSVEFRAAERVGLVGHPTPTPAILAELNGGDPPSRHPLSDPAIRVSIDDDESS
jgi:hypothetical protein